MYPNNRHNCNQQLPKKGDLIIVDGIYHAGCRNELYGIVRAVFKGFIGRGSGAEPIPCFLIYLNNDSTATFCMKYEKIDNDRFRALKDLLPMPSLNRAILEKYRERPMGSWTPFFWRPIETYFWDDSKLIKKNKKIRMGELEL